MPTVRTYQRQIAPEKAPNVERSGYAIPQLQTPAPRVPTSTEGVTHFGNTVAKVGEELYAAEQHKQDQIRLLDADRQAGDLENGLMYDPKSGALNVRGQAAFGLIDTVGKQWDDATGKIRQGLSNDRQRNAFDQYNVAKRRSLMDRLNQHIAKETYRVDGEALEGKVENETSAAIADGRPERINEALDSVRQAYADYGDRYGISPEQTKAATEKAVSRIHVGVIDRMLSDGNDIQAKVYYEHTEPEILGEHRGAIEKTLRVGSVRGESQRIADTIVNAAGPDYTLSGLVDEVQKKTQDPEVLDAATTRIHAWYERAKEDQRVQTEKRNQAIREQLEAEKERREREKEAHDKLAHVTVPNLIDQGKPKDVKRYLDSIDPKIWADSTEQDREGWERYGKRMEDGDKVKTDVVTLLRLRKMAYEKPNDFLKLDLTSPAVLNRIGESELKGLSDLQAAIYKGDQKEADKQLDDFRTADQVINNSLATMGIDPKNKANESTIARVHQLVGERTATLARNSGKKPTHQDIQTITDDVISTSFTQKGWIWDTEKPLVTATISDVPAGDRKQIEKALRDNHRIVTDDAILDLFIRTKERQRKK